MCLSMVGRRIFVALMASWNWSSKALNAFQSQTLVNFAQVLTRCRVSAKLRLVLQIIGIATGAGMTRLCYRTGMMNSGNLGQMSMIVRQCAGQMMAISERGRCSAVMSLSERRAETAETTPVMFLWHVKMAASWCAGCGASAVESKDTL